MEMIRMVIITMAIIRRGIIREKVTNAKTTQWEIIGWEIDISSRKNLGSILEKQILDSSSFVKFAAIIMFVN